MCSVLKPVEIIVCRPFFRNLNAKVKIAGEYHYIYPYSNSKNSPVSSKNHEMSLNLAGTQYGVSQNVTRNNAKIKFLVDQEAFSVNLHLCIASNAIPMLFIYHFYD